MPWKSPQAEKKNWQAECPPHCAPQAADFGGGAGGFARVPFQQPVTAECPIRKNECESGYGRAFYSDMVRV
jgi:hypothetical protein